MSPAVSFRLLSALCLLPLLSLVAAAQDAVPGAPLGAWRVGDGPGDHWLFQADRAAVSTDGEPTFFRAEYHDDGATLEVWGNLVRLTFERDGDHLWITRNGERRRFAPLAEVPAALRVTEVPFATDVSLDDNARDTLAEELSARCDRDQAIRRRLQDEGGFSNQEVVSEMVRLDRDNTAWLKRQVGMTGWFDADRFGADAAHDAFLLVQHSGDLGLMLSALPAIRADYERQAIDGGAFALLYDRLALNLGGRQSFGSQIGTTEAAGMFVCPMDDPGDVDSRRAAMGMGPIAEYLELFRDDNGGELPKHLTDGRSFEAAEG